MSSRSRKREKTTMTKKKNPSYNDLKKEPEIVMISSSSVSEEPNEEEEEQEEDQQEEEEAKSSNNSNQNMNEEAMEEEEDIKKKGKTKKKKNISNGSGGAGGEAGSCCFPTNRIKKIVRNEGFDFRVSQEAIFLINKSTEHFLDQFCEDAYVNVVKDRKKAVHYKHLSSVVSKAKRYDFLADFVPEKFRAEDALSERKLAGP